MLKRVVNCDRWKCDIKTNRRNLASQQTSAQIKKRITCTTLFCFIKVQLLPIRLTKEERTETTAQPNCVSPTTKWHGKSASKRCVRGGHIFFRVRVCAFKMCIWKMFFSCTSVCMCVCDKVCNMHFDSVGRYFIPHAAPFYFPID